MKLDDDREQEISMSNEHLLPDLRDPIFTDSKENAVTNGVANEAKLTEESKMREINEDFDMTMQEISDDSVQPKDGDAVQVDGQEADNTQKPGK